LFLFENQEKRHDFAWHLFGHRLPKKDRHPYGCLSFFVEGGFFHDLRRRSWASSPSAAGGGSSEDEKGENKKFRVRISATETTIFSTGQ
ncbi:MAG: hypothetical protein J6B55_07495, partial [Clostridia bacterium]|nr:hypothetical protein [Clostridia bacterium]